MKEFGAYPAMDLLNRLLNIKLIRNFGIYAFGTALLAVTKFFLIPIYTRFLLPEDFGKISILWVFIPIVYIIINFGLTSAFSIKFYKISKQARDKIIYNIFAYCTLVAGIILLPFIVKGNLLSALLIIDLDYSASVKILGIIFFMVFYSFFLNLLRMEEKAKLFVIMSIFSALLIAGLNILFIVYLNQGYVGYINAFLLDHLIMGLLGIVYILKNYPFNNFRIDLPFLKNLLKIGIPLIPNGLFILLLTSGDRYLLNRFGTLEQVAYYSVGYKFASIFYTLLVVPFGKTRSPIVFRKFAESASECREFLRKTNQDFLALMLLGVLAYNSVLKEVFHIAVGKNYWPGFNIIWIILFSYVLWGVCETVGMSIVVKEKTSKILVFTTIAVSLNIGLNVLLIPKFSIFGAAFATLASYLVLAILYYIYSQKLFAIDYDVKNNLIIIGLFLTGFLIQNGIGILKLNVLPSAFLKVSIFAIVTFIYLKANLLQTDIKALLIGQEGRQ